MVTETDFKFRAYQTDVYIYQIDKILPLSFQL
jgi:hypothetical protein